jgi:hypothetical protein
MKFKSDPGRVLTDGKTHRAIGKFDEDGIFETTDPYYIQKLKLYFPVVDESVPEKPIEPEKKAEQPKAPAATVRTCKTCGATFESQGALLAHYRTEHPKEKKV